MEYCHCPGAYTSLIQHLEVKPGDKESKSLQMEVRAARNSPFANLYNTGFGTAQLTISSINKGVTITIPISPNSSIEGVRFFTDDTIAFELVGTNTTASVEIITPN